MLTRRNLLVSAAVVPLAGCTAAQQAGIVTAYNNFLAQVQALVAKGCGVGAGFIPTINSIEAIASLLYPGVGTAIAGIVNSAIAVAAKLCQALPTPVPASLRARLSASGPGNPVVIGAVVVNGVAVQVTGYR